MNRQQRVAHVVVLVAIGVCFHTVPKLAADCPELVGRMPGPISGVAVEGDYAYLGIFGGLAIADVSNPSAPRAVGEVTSPTHFDLMTTGVAVSGVYAYGAAGPGLTVYDVSMPSAPMMVGAIDTPGEAQGVAVEGGYAYVAEYEGLRVIDVSTPSAPVAVGFVDTPGWPRAVAVSGDYAYVAGGYLRVIDVSTPSAPVEVGFYDTPDNAVGVAVSGGFAYVAAGYSGLRVIDVSTPSAPMEVGFVDTPGWASGVAVSGGYAYVGDRGELGFSHGLRVIDVSAPSEPVEVGFVETPVWADDVAVSGHHAYVGGGEQSPSPSDDQFIGNLRVIDVSMPSAPLQVGSFGALGRAADSAVSGDHAYLATLAGLQVIDVTAPSSPTEVGHLVGRLTSITGPHVVDTGRYLYACESGCGEVWCLWWCHVIDVTTPSSPVEVGLLGGWGGVADVAGLGNYAYVANDGIFRVIDVSTPAAPVEVGSIDIPLANGVAVSGDFAYVAAGEAGLRVIDVSTPSAPVEVGFVDTPGYASGVAVSDGYVYVVGANEWPASTGTLRVIDVSAPSTQLEVGTVETPDHAWNVAVSGGYAYVAWGTWDTGESGLSGIDVSTPSAPVEVGFIDTPGRAGAVAVDGGFVFFAAAEAGLYIFDECDPLADAHECFIPAAAVAAGAQGAFFQTDVEINNTGVEEAEVQFQWLPRGEDNSQPAESEPIALAPGQSLRYENVLTELFNLEPDSLGALKMVASTESVIGMSRTYNAPGAKAAGTFGQGLPAMRATEMIKRTERRRIIFLSEDFSSRANVGCVNGTAQPLRINIGVFDDEGTWLETKTMDLGPYSSDQINHVFQGHLMGNGYVDVWAGSNEALYYCYGSVLDNSTSDPTTILPQVPSHEMTFIPAAALAAGLEGAFFQTDVDLNNVGSTDLTYELMWLPRGVDNTEPVSSDTFSLAPGAGVRYANVLDEVFGLEADQVGALAVEASGIDLLAMSRTYNLPSAEVAGTFGQELPGIPADRMIPTGVKKRIIFMSENDDSRANVGCVNGVGIEVAVQIELYDADGVKLETKYMMLPPYSNRQINGIFQDYAPVNGYVDVRTSTPDASIYCYGSVLDNLTSDPTTVLPQ